MAESNRSMFLLNYDLIHHNLNLVFYMLSFDYFRSNTLQFKVQYTDYYLNY